MSQFFQSFEEEKKESKKKINELRETVEIKLTKSEQKLKELKQKVDEVLRNDKNFDKNFKKLMVEIKKYTNHFNNVVPDFVNELFESERVLKSKTNSSLVQTFMNDFIKEEEVILVKKVTKPKQVSLEAVFSMEDGTEKESILLNLFGTLETEKNCEIGVILYSSYYKSKKITQMISMFKRLIPYFDENIVFINVFKKRLDYQISKIYDNLTEECFDSYLELLDDLTKKMSDNFFVKERILEFDFFKKNLFYKSENPLFNILYYIRENNWNDAYSIQQNYNFTGYTSREIAILYEFALFSARFGHFNMSLDILASDLFDDNLFTGFKTNLYTILAILSQKIKGEIQLLNEKKIPLTYNDKVLVLFFNFLDVFKAFDSNFLILESSDEIMEICRAFYLLENFDIDESSRILKTVSGFECKSFLESTIQYIN